MSSPASYYYLLPDQWCIIPCQGTVTDHTPSLTLNATFYRNGTALPFPLPADHYLVLDDLENTVGLVISGASQDSHTTYHCVVGGMMSMRAQVYVAGKPSFKS